MEFIAASQGMILFTKDTKFCVIFVVGRKKIEPFIQGCTVMSSFTSTYSSLHPH